MGELRVYQIDAFTTSRFQGNPAGVVTNADGLSALQMQAIARELNNSETAFILAPQRGDHDVQIRFFTPITEVPVCGHATVAAHYALALEGRLPGPCRQLTGAGVQRIFTASSDGNVLVTIEQGAPRFTPPLGPDLVHRILSALGANSFGLDPLCPIQVVSTGNGCVLIGLRRREVLQALSPDFGALAALSEEAGASGFFTFTLDTPINDDAYTWGRMFAPAIGVAEDPVTGNANGALGAYLVKHRLLEVKAGYATYRARQSARDGRAGWMDVIVRAEAGHPTAVRIQGQAVMCFKATIPLD